MSTTKQITDHSVALYASHEQAQAAVLQLSAAGYEMQNLSIIGQDYHTEEQPLGFITTGHRMISWGKFGAFWGSIWGLLFGSAVLLLPGVGTLLIAGYLVAALEGAVVGGAFGVLGGALSGLGIPEKSVLDYEKAIKAGSYVLIAHGTSEDVQNAKNLLASSSATSVSSFTTESLTHA